MIRLTSFPILLAIAYYERQSKQIQALTFSETITATAERVLDTLPKTVKRLTFLEGIFAGGASDIDVIFELEQEIANNHSSALDMEELESSSGKLGDTLTLRRVSERSSRRFSGQSTYAANMASSTSGQSVISNKDAQSDTPQRPPAQPFVRPRMNSLMQREHSAASYMSPLAQIYTPLVVDDDIIEEQDEGTVEPSPPHVSAPGLPRRRLSSMHHFPPMAPVHIQRKLNASRGQGLHEPILQESPASIELAVPKERERGASQPEEVSRVIEEEEEGFGSAPQIGDRLNRIEERQKRMEELLLHISQGLISRKD